MIYKKKSETAHSTFSNIFFFVRLLFKISPVLVIGDFLMGIHFADPSYQRSWTEIYH